MQAMRERDDSQPLGGIVELDPAYLGGEASGGKHRRGASGKTAFLVFALVSANRCPERLRLSPAGGFRPRVVEVRAQRQLQPGMVVRSDELRCFQGVQVAGREHQRRITGGGEGSCHTPGLSRVNRLLGNVKRAIYGTCHARAPQYAERYLAEFACRCDRRYGLAELVPRLAYVASCIPPLPDRLLTLAGTAG